MNRIEDDPVIGRFFYTPAKKAKWMVLIKIGYLLWLAFIILGIVYLLLQFFYN